MTQFKLFLSSINSKICTRPDDGIIHDVTIYRKTEHTHDGATGQRNTVELLPVPIQPVVGVVACRARLRQLMRVVNFGVLPSAFMGIFISMN